MYISFVFRKMYIRFVTKLKNTKSAMNKDQRQEVADIAKRIDLTASKISTQIAEESKKLPDGERKPNANQVKSQKAIDLLQHALYGMKESQSVLNLVAQDMMEDFDPPEKEQSHLAVVEKETPDNSPETIRQGYRVVTSDEVPETESNEKCYITYTVNKKGAGIENAFSMVTDPIRPIKTVADVQSLANSVLKFYLQQNEVPELEAKELYCTVLTWKKLEA